jgi:hypothetical protein
MIEDNGDEEVCETHAREDQARERTERPKRHFDLTLRLPRALESEIEADGRDSQGDGRECSEYDDENFIWQGESPSLFRAVMLYEVFGSVIFPMNRIVPEWFSRIAKTNGRSIRMTGPMLVRPIPTDVTAAASVPSSST